MKHVTTRSTSLRGLGLGLIASSVLASHAFGASDPRPRLDPEMTGPEYAPLVEKLLQGGLKDTDPLQTILLIGKRNLQWLDLVNSQRPDAQKLQLSTAETQVGYPIDQPTLANRDLVSKGWNTVRDGLPESMRAVLVDNAPLTQTPAVADDVFLAQVRLVDRAYQRASRWLLEEPYLDYYAQDAEDDIRGYYYLNQEPDLDTKLRTFASLDDATKTRLQGLLVGECRNQERSLTTCTTNFTDALGRDGNAINFHQRYRDNAATHFNSYFEIQVKRPDVTWDAAANVLSVPFRNPNRDDVKSWLSTNIEDEWRWNGWALKLNFEDQGDDNMTHVQFKDGATPHVNAVGGSEITMDANRNLTEYSSRWTIRHEYGHTLGFVDCYLEFYDKAQGVMINYQLDITNLMCSRRGHLQEKHFLELKKNYGATTLN